MKISVSSYSFDQYISKGQMTQLDCVAKAKELGFDAIEFVDLAGANVEEQKEYAKKIKEEADRVGIEINAYIIGGHLYQETQEASDAEVARLKGQLDVANILGAKVMRHDVCYRLGKTGDSRSFDLMLPTIAENIRKVTEYGQSLGIRTCSENHGYVAQDSERMEKLFNAVNHDNYGLLADMGNFLVVDENPLSAMSRVAPYAIHAHAKDMMVREKPFYGYTLLTRGCNYLLGTVIGEGIVPVEQCIRILKRVNYDGFLTIEYEGLGDCIEGISKSLKNLKKILANIEG